MQACSNLVDSKNDSLMSLGRSVARLNHENLKYSTDMKPHCISSNSLSGGISAGCVKVAQLRALVELAIVRFVIQARLALGRTRQM